MEYGGLSWVLSTIYEEINYGEKLPKHLSGKIVYIPLVE
jgi:hypothetical protein